MRRQSQEEIDEAKAEAERNPAKLILSPDLLVMALEKFHVEREEEAINQQMMGVVKNKKANFESEEQKAERARKKEKLFWERLLTILSP